MFYLTPVWSTLFGLLLLNETIKWNRWVAIVLGLLGLYFIVGGWSADAKPINIGDWFGLASGVCWGIGSVVIKKNPEINMTGAVTVQHGFSLLVALGGCLLLPGISVMPELSGWVASTPVMLAFSWLGLVPSMLALFWASTKLFPGRVGILMMTEALVAVISAAILLDEQVLPLEWAGVILIVVAGLIEVTSQSAESHQSQ